MSEETFQRIDKAGTVSKGNVLETARIAGVMGAKKTADLIPMCHPLNLTHVQVDFFPDAATRSIRIEGTARIFGSDRGGDGGLDRCIRGGANASMTCARPSIKP